ncbi:hypothetical protein DXG01_016586, partial [Tephrocybe rancida]
MFISLRGRGVLNGHELIEMEQVISDVKGDVLDTVTTLDKLDGGISVLLHCPGFKASPGMSAEKVTVDLIISPQELSEAGNKELSKALAIMVQSFAKDVVLPYLERFNKRCIVEGIAAPPPP